jgi:hypothetical protein
MAGDEAACQRPADLTRTGRRCVVATGAVVMPSACRISPRAVAIIIAVSAKEPNATSVNAIEARTWTMS